MPDTTTLIVRVSRETKEALGKIAGDAHRTESFVVTAAVESYIKQQILWREK